MKVLARTLRQLEALGCVKQVRAQANSNIATSIYFKCIKLIREPDEKEWQLFLSPHRGLSNTTTVGDNEDLDAAGELQEDYGLDEIEDRGTSGISAPVKDLREVGRPIAQWGGDQCLNNYLFDLINRTGTHGMSTMVRSSSPQSRVILTYSRSGYQTLCVWGFGQKTPGIPTRKARKSMASLAAFASSPQGNHQRYCHEQDCRSLRPLFL